MSTLYKIACGASSLLLVFLSLQLLFTPVAFVEDVGLPATTATTVLARRAAMFMLGLAAFAAFALRERAGLARRHVSTAMATTWLGLAGMSAHAHAAGLVNASILTALVVEAVLGAAFAIVLIAELRHRDLSPPAPMREP